MLTLADTPAGTTVVIRKLNTDDATTHQLSALGLLPSHLVTIAKNPRGKSPLVIEIGTTRLALGREIAREIEVIPVDPRGSQKDTRNNRNRNK